jgi:hypothetical protein
MTFIARPKQPAGTLLALAAGLIAIVALAVAVAARADSTPVGHLPAGPVSTWRLARPYDANVVRQISEADVDASVVLVFKVVGRGKTSLAFGLTRGDTSSKAVRSATHKIVSR